MSQYQSAAAIVIFLGVVTSFTLLGLGSAFGLEGVDLADPPEQNKLNISNTSNAIDDTETENVTYSDEYIDGNYAFTGWTLEEGKDKGKLRVKLDSDIENLTLTFQNKELNIDGVKWGVEGSTQYSYPQNVDQSGDYRAESLNNPTALIVTWNVSEKGFFSDEEAVRETHFTQLKSGNFEQNIVDWGKSFLGTITSLGSSNPIIFSIIVLPITIVAVLLFINQIPTLGD